MLRKLLFKMELKKRILYIKNKLELKLDEA